MRFILSALFSIVLFGSPALADVYTGNFPILEEMVAEIEAGNFHKKSSLKASVKGEVFSTLGITGSVPKVLVIDDATGFVDPDNVHQVHVYIKTDFRYLVREYYREFEWEMVVY